MEEAIKTVFFNEQTIVTFFFVFAPSAPAGIFLWLANKEKWPTIGPMLVLRQSFSKVWLDTSIVTGILGTAIGLVFMLKTMNSISEVYGAVRIALMTFFWGGLFAGIGFCLHQDEVNLDLRFSKGALITTIFVIGFITINQMMAAGGIHLFFLSEAAIVYFVGSYIFVYIFSSFSSKGWELIGVQTNVVTTIGGLACGIIVWFVNGADYPASTDAIYFGAVILFYGSAVFLIIYSLSLYRVETSKHDYQTKTWHLAEAAAFFIFLIYAPVGTTEYFRESTDQANQKANNEAQQLEINQLKAQIKLLTEKVGEI